VTAPGQARLFVAVWPPPEVFALVAALPRAEQPGVRWTTRDQWHVTLRFLGTCDVVASTDALGSLQAPCTTAVLGPRVGRMGRGVLIVPVGGLEAVAAAVILATASIGPPPEDRPFLGHLTLARLRGVRACGLTDTTVEASWPVSSVSLVESHLHPRGARYETILEVPLGPEVPSC
jgi:2'-5' RNA ligase